MTISQNKTLFCNTKRSRNSFLKQKQSKLLSRQTKVVYSSHSARSTAQRSGHFYLLTNEIGGICLHAFDGWYRSGFNGPWEREKAKKMRKRVRKWEKQTSQEREIKNKSPRQNERVQSKDWIWGHWRKQKEEVKNSRNPLEEICSCANCKAELNSGVRVGIGKLYLMPVIFNEAARELKTRTHSMICMVRAEQSPDQTSS